VGDILASLGAITPDEATLAAYEQDLGDGRRFGEVLVSHGATTGEQVQQALYIQSADEPAFPTTASSGLRTLQAVVLLVMVFAAAGLMTTTDHRTFGALLYACLAIPYLLVKLALSARYRVTVAPAPAELDLTAVIPFYNEDPVVFERCLAAVVAQTRPARQIFLIDDGSDDPRCLEIAGRWAANHPHIVVHRFGGNRGKRDAQVWAFDQATTDVVATVDSDTILRADAFAEGLKPLADPRVEAVCGYARALNADQNLLTRLIDVRYANAFLFERAAYSVLGSVLCSTGVLSLWRRHVVLDNKDDYLNQQFLGIKVGYGDDRRLTAYALRTGRVVLQETAVAVTSVPTTLRGYVRQQVRWNKSFFRESLLLLAQSRPNRWAWWIGLTELGYWVVLSTMLMLSIVVRPVAEGHLPAWQYGAFVALMAYARSTRMLGDGGRLVPKSLLLAPLYGVLNLVLLVPLRFYSLIRLRDGSWGTRWRGAKHRGDTAKQQTAPPSLLQKRQARRDARDPGWVIPAEILAMVSTQREPAHEPAVLEVTGPAIG
jgi:hyaluronan synthase